MKRIAFSDMHNLKAAEVRDNAPLVIPVLGEEYVLVKFADVVVVGDMHPIAKRNFKAMENRVRTAMGNPQEISRDTVRAHKELEAVEA